MARDLLAECNRWCIDNLPPRPTPPKPTLLERLTGHEPSQRDYALVSGGPSD